MSLSTMINSILRFVPGLSPMLIESFIQDAYRRLCLIDWNRLNIMRNIYTVRPYSTGVVTVASNGTCTGTGTNWTNSMVGSFMRIYYSDAFFEIASVTDETTLTLRDWTGEAITTPQPYTIFKNIYVVPSDIGQIFSINYNVTLVKKSQNTFNKFDPSRLTFGEPLWWAFASLDSSQNIRIEIYPIPDAVYPLRIYGKARISPLTADSTPLLNEDLVEAAALLECYRMKALQSTEAGEWQVKLREQEAIYASILQAAREEDFMLADYRSITKDVIGEIDYPPSDTFAASHDVD